MIEIAKLADITSQRAHFSIMMVEYLQTRFKTLYENYRSFGIVPLERFSLSEFGEIMVAETYGEVEHMLFEDMRAISLGTEAIYMGTYLRNNEICCDVIIPQSILTLEQTQRLEEEL